MQKLVQNPHSKKETNAKTIFSFLMLSLFIAILAGCIFMIIVLNNFFKISK